MTEQTLTPEKLLALKAQYLMPCVYHFYRKPMVIVRGEGCHVYDQDGKAYLDAYSGVGVNNCGHCNPAIVERTTAQLHKLQHMTTIYLTEPMLKLAAALAAFLPGKLNRSFFCTSGSEANEGALLLAKLATGKNDFIALSRSLHGRTYLTAGLTGIAFWRSDPQPPQNIHFAASPVCSQCPYQLQYPACHIRCADEIEAIAEQQPQRIAAFIAEPINGNGGIVVPPDGYFEKVQAILKKHGILMIMDEAQTGFCRTGKRFGFQHYAIEPDIVTVCKALGNGLPISAFIATDAVAECYTRPGASTFGGNPVCAEAALGVLAFMQEHELDEKACVTGTLIRARLLRLQRQHPLIREVRGRGLMLGAELVRADGSPAVEELDALLEHLKDLGVLVGKTGPERNVLTLMPPLVLSGAEAKYLCTSLEQAFAELAITEVPTVIGRVC
ncbi:MAG: aspartate aminotransferase family protein [Gammaproteobacteria bacterium HGW-Gammaproteobacteria-3]|nr:MAG: aspartate aminotransferase family protein [Gammaproteobacteria bacterium HGW-Gammaproteobacteria-3]